MVRCGVLALACIALAARADEPTLIAPGEARSPAEEARSFRLPPGFTAQLVAAEPDIQKPINMAFDARGRLWVTCSVEYPFAAKDRPGRDTIKILDDFGPDGRARKITTFADGLNIPIGILPDPDGNGAIVFSIPNIWRLRDIDGDGKADSREPLLTGFGTRDTHGMVNGLVRGFDGWIYACHGYLNDSTIQAKDGSRVVMNSGNTFRFRPDGSRVELVCRGQVNPFGQCLDPLGNHYTACCHSKPITQLLRGAVYSSFSKPHDGLGFAPDLVRNYRGSTALCGLAWYDAEHYPAPFRDRLFLGDVINNCINMFDFERQGASYSAKQTKDDFLKSDDPWFRPVDIKLGPDGALYIADFYNRIIGHYEVPLDHPGRDRSSGRIWRIVYTGENSQPPASLLADWAKGETDTDVVRDLGHPNITVRLLAISELERRAKPETPRGTSLRTALLATARSGPALERVHALWTLERLLKRDTIVFESALHAPDPFVRIHAMRMLGEQSNWSAIERGAAIHALNDRDALVRRIAADALAKHPSTDALAALIATRREPATVADSFLLHTVRMALRDHIANPTIAWPAITDEQVEVLADAALGTTNERAANFVAANLGVLASRGRRRMPEIVHHAARFAAPTRIDAIRTASERIAGDNAELGARLLLAIARGAQERGTTGAGTGGDWPARVARQLFASPKVTDVRLGVELVVALKLTAFADELAVEVGDRKRPDDLRIASASALLALDGGKRTDLLLVRLADGSESPVLRGKLAEQLASLPNPAVRAAMLEALRLAPERSAVGIAAALAGRKENALALLTVIGAGEASPRLLLERTVQVKLDALKSPSINERIAKLTEGLPPADAALSELLMRSAKMFGSAQADAAAGAKLFGLHCANCHQVAGHGAKIGPHLDGIGVRGIERLLEDTLDPNRNVDPAFRTTNILMKAGQSVSGLLLREEGEVLVLADNQGKELRIEKSKVESRSVSPLSAMPANWSEQLPEKDFHDLMAYLLSLKSK